MILDFLVFFKHFGYKYGVRGSIFGEHFGSSKHVQQNTEIFAQALIRKRKQIINHKNQQDSSPNSFVTR